jgi:hypothetical protein
MATNIAFVCSVLSLSLVAVSFAYTERALQDKIVNLPGAEGLDITFNQFSGYIEGMLFKTRKIFLMLVFIAKFTPPVGNTKMLHYWFVESLRSPESDPLGKFVFCFFFFLKFIS